ncbi:hypothetical protein MTO96_012597 [Rhipicephalus appendiculatus]
MVARITELRPEITKIMATLVLPRAPDRRRACLNRPSVVRFNRATSTTCFERTVVGVARYSRLGTASAWPGTSSRRCPSEF